MVDSITNRHYPVVRGAVLDIALIFIGVNLVIDLARKVVDPRIRFH